MAEAPCAPVWGHRHLKAARCLLTSSPLGSLCGRKPWPQVQLYPEKVLIHCRRDEGSGTRAHSGTMSVNKGGPGGLEWEVSVKDARGRANSAASKGTRAAPAGKQGQRCFQANGFQAVGGPSHADDCSVQASLEHQSQALRRWVRCRPCQRHASGGLRMQLGQPASSRRCVRNSPGSPCRPSCRRRPWPAQQKHAGMFGTVHMCRGQQHSRARPSRAPARPAAADFGTHTPAARAGVR